MKKLARVASVLFCSASLYGIALPESAIALPEEPKPIQLAQANNGLEILTTGTGSKQIFRFAPSVGSQQTTVMAIQAATTVGGKQGIALTLPAIAITIETTVMEANADTGSYRGQFIYQAVEVGDGETLPPGASDSIRQQLQALVGLNGEFAIDAQGNLTDFSLELPTTSDNPVAQQILQQVSEALKQLSNPFPAEAIGVGAQWQVTQDVAVSGIEVTQTTTYELLDYQGNNLTLAFKTDQSGSGSLADFPGLPEGFDPQIESLNSTGEGTLTLNLEQLLPSTLQVQSETEMVMTIKPPNASQPIDLQVQVSSQVDLSDQE
ncbi:MAG: hypothetical protein F6J87_04760 [Spirulina sp. SIO3F2]|nr:hypothetical protein [Spirulina sp. SIO3F2]